MVLGSSNRSRAALYKRSRLSRLNLAASLSNAAALASVSRSGPNATCHCRFVIRARTSGRAVNLSAAGSTERSSAGTTAGERATEGERTAEGDGSAADDEKATEGEGAAAEDDMRLETEVVIYASYRNSIDEFVYRIRYAALSASTPCSRLSVSVIANGGGSNK